VVIAEGAGPPGTIVRIRANIHIELAVETAAATLQAWGIGVGLFDDRALAASTGAGNGLPSPLDDADDEKWMWIQYGFLGTSTLAAAGTEGDGTGRRLSVDIPVPSRGS
jgi:hypothetical protein